MTIGQWTVDESIASTIHFGGWGGGGATRFRSDAVFFFVGGIGYSYVLAWNRVSEWFIRELFFKQTVTPVWSYLLWYSKYNNTLSRFRRQGFGDGVNLTPSRDELETSPLNKQRIICNSPPPPALSLNNWMDLFGSYFAVSIYIYIL